MLAVTSNRYSVVFGAQLSCKTFYRTDIYSEEAIPLLDRHIKLMLLIFFFYGQKSFPCSHMSAQVKGFSIHQCGQEC